MVRSPWQFVGVALGDDGVGDEGDLRELLDVEEVFAADVAVAVGVAGVEAGGLDGGVDLGVGDVLGEVQGGSASLNWPRTLLMPAWRTVKPISLCEVSRVQVPVVTFAGSAMVVLLESGGYSVVRLIVS